jgi:hypothetical protein
MHFRLWLCVSLIVWYVLLVFCAHMYGMDSVYICVCVYVGVTTVSLCFQESPEVEDDMTTNEVRLNSLIGKLVCQSKAK